MPPPIEKHLNSIKVNLTSLKPHRYISNMSSVTRKALDDLSRDKSIIIRNADKGNHTVIQNTSDYITKGQLHLSDTNIYKYIEGDYTSSLVSSINKFLAT